MTIPPDFTSDCQNCAALCCVALAFDKGEMFAFGKDAGTACRNLEGHHCKLHADLGAKGMRGCAQYECEGAGQRVVQEVFGGKSWQDTPELLAPMLQAFARMRQVQRQRLLLHTAEALPLPPDQKKQINRFQEALTPADCWSETALNRLEQTGVFEAITLFFKSLAGVLPPQPLSTDKPTPKKGKD